ncbi:MAG: hypothetical protein ACI4WU_01595 [Bacilli bacterium]
MNDILDIEIILTRKKYPKIYNLGIIISIIILIFIYIIFTYNYQTYYISKGKVLNNNLELLVNIEDIKYITNNKVIILDGQAYNYMVSSIGNDLLVDETYNNYQYVYLKISNLNTLNNYVYEVKIPKENQKLVKYFKKYF